MSALNSPQAQAAEMMVEKANEIGLYAFLDGASGASWYVKVNGYKVRFSDHNPTHHNDFNIQHCERTGWNGFERVADAIEEVLDEIIKSENEEE